MISIEESKPEDVEQEEDDGRNQTLLYKTIQLPYQEIRL